MWQLRGFARLVVIGVAMLIGCSTDRSAAVVDAGRTPHAAGSRRQDGGAVSADASTKRIDAATGVDASTRAKDGGRTDASGGPVAASKCGGIAIPVGSGAASAGKLEEWENVTPAGISLTNADFSNDNYGAQDVLVDPVRPSDLYAFFCHQGVYKSEDYGRSWKKVNTGMNAAKIDSGKPWGEAIDSDRCRDPKTPPTLYSAGSQGEFWRSRDGGVSWESFALPDDGKARPQDGYDVDVDPYDGKHLILGFHEESGLAESSDGGETWSSVKLASEMATGISWYAFFIDTGEPAGTRKTWLMIAQATGGHDGTWRTDDGGANWTRVESNEHGHGSAQIFQAGGIVYMAGVYGTQGWGVYRSADFGATWKHIGLDGGQNGVFGTQKFIYAESGGANAGGIDQMGSERAPLADDMLWSAWAVHVGNGPKRAAVTNDGTHAIIVGGNWLSGLVRYVEP
jgi:hypothetical protein